MPLLIAGAVGLVAWATYLAFTLPRHYDVNRWRGTWVGFDLAMAVMLALTAYAAWRRRLIVVVPATVAGTMLLVDAWFDVHLASRADVGAALVSALIEVPSGLALLVLSVRLVRRAARRLADLGQEWDDLVESPEGMARAPGAS